MILPLGARYARHGKSCHQATRLKPESDGLSSWKRVCFLAWPVVPGLAAGSHIRSPGRHGLPRAFVVENQRERILPAVADVTSVAGYREMTVEDVIVTAGISRRTFYEHFTNKDDAFLAAFDAVLAKLFFDRAGGVRGRGGRR